MQGVRDGFWRGALRGVTITAAAGLGLTAASAQAASRPYVLTSFDTIRLIAPVKLSVTTGGGTSAHGEGDRAMLDRVDMAVSGRTLTVRLRPAQPGDKPGVPPTLFVSTEDVRRVTLQGGGSLAIDRMKGLRGEIVLTGAGDVSVANAAVDQLNVVVAGNGRVTLGGKAGTLSAIVSGPGTLEAAGLEAKDVRLTNDGPGSAAVAASGTAHVIAKGSGDVAVTGKAACTVDRGGTGAIICGGQEY